MLSQDLELSSLVRQKLNLNLGLKSISHVRPNHLDFFLGRVPLQIQLQLMICLIIIKSVELFNSEVNLISLAANYEYFFCSI